MESDGPSKEKSLLRLKLNKMMSTWLLCMDLFPMQFLSTGLRYTLRLLFDLLAIEGDMVIKVVVYLYASHYCYLVC